MLFFTVEVLMWRYIASVLPCLSDGLTSFLRRPTVYHNGVCHAWQPEGVLKDM